MRTVEETKKAILSEIRHREKMVTDLLEEDNSLIKTGRYYFNELESICFAQQALKRELLVLYRILNFIDEKLDIKLD